MQENSDLQGSTAEKELSRALQYGEMMKGLAADLQVQKRRGVLRLDDITPEDREEFRRAMWARRRRERMDEKARQCREMRAKRPVDYASLPMNRRPIRRIVRSEAAKARRRGH
ncbi:hypothetical protein R3P38DRAFT_2809190 [Favolaschia claudopus]|uniref:Uncharacterized protein n=1 Tax=Favolaschia claudopus TaxID=2862362 RepID=A0AAV9ZEC7_9AGAR